MAELVLGRAALGNVFGDCPVLQVGRAVMEGPADAAFVHELAGQRDRRHAPVVEPDHVVDARLLDGPGHFLGFLDVHRQRLFANDHLAVLRRGDGDRAVHVIGRADVDQVDVLGADQLLPVRLDALVSPDVGERL